MISLGKDIQFTIATLTIKHLEKNWTKEVNICVIKILGVGILTYWAKQPPVMLASYVGTG